MLQAEGKKLFPKQLSFGFRASIMPQELNNSRHIPKIRLVSAHLPIPDRLHVYAEAFGDIPLAKAQIKPPSPEMVTDSL